MTDESPKEEILVNVTPREVRAALLENGVLQEVFIERASRRGLISNIYKGKVTRVLPGMQAAFVDIGLERTAFLHASDIVRGNASEENDGEVAIPDIRELTREGEEVLVQVVKDPLGSKGARLTTFITLPSRFLVFLPTGSGVGVSARIEEEDERLRLREEVEGMLDGDEQGGGVIVRTAAEGMSRDAMRADLEFLRKLWAVVQVECRKGKVKTLIHEDLPLPIRVLRDLITSDVERILVDSEADFDKMKAFTQSFLPEIEPMLELYKRRRPIFDLHGTEDEIRKALERSISLKSGGYVIIDQTEAMTTIDVNTGGFVGHRNLEETHLQDESRSRGNNCTAIASKKSRRHRHYRLYRYGGRGSPGTRNAGAGAVHGARSRQASDHAGVASGAGGDDAQAYAGKPAAYIV
jgi:ribonuclease G